MKVWRSVIENLETSLKDGRQKTKQSVRYNRESNNANKLKA